jgi:DNA-directed RNA polymerase subunit RPC12/RpoP
LEEKSKNEIDSLCPECGHAFKTYLDRIIKSEEDTSKEENIECPVCGCGECKVGK